ncbi:hypothetical protein ANN_24786 [Periplaneta americana]|uniref:Endonuclease/exonuclease/phosphatase domain-containing protein n=1 Tax=Periplaneta americana TaxID=6978 RepID=A0ABQ8S042_PERAM|nr:hypothetical protein ANN_24786 [Periplaneta americana]
MLTNNCTTGRNDRLYKRGDGVCTYIRNDLKPKVLLKSQGDAAHPEYIFIEIQASLQKCLVAIVYKPPKAGHLSDLEIPLTNLLPQYEHVLVFGDFNTNLLALKSNGTKQLCNMLEAFNLKILPLNPTHHTATTETLIDLIITNNPDRIVTSGQLPVPGISAHDLIFAEYSLQCPKAAAKFITYRDLEHVDDDQLISDAMELPWHTIFNLVTVDEKLTAAFNNMVIQLFDKHAPLRKRNATHRPAPWMTDSIRNLMASRDAAYRKYRHDKSEENFYIYKKIRNRTTQNIRNAKRRHALCLVDPSITPRYLYHGIFDSSIYVTCRE